MQIFSNALSTLPFSKLDTWTIERFYRDFYTSVTCYETCFQDNATIAFLKNENDGRHYPYCGTNNSDSSSIVHALPIIFRYAGSGGLLDNVATAVKIVQVNSYAVAQAQAAARILEQVCARSE